MNDKSVEVKDKDGDEGNTIEDTDFKVASWGYRHQQSIILFCTLTIAYSMRVCMGVALVAMTHHEETYNTTSNFSVIDVDVDDFEVSGFFNALMLIPPYPTFNWTKKVQDTVMASFFWGYMLLQIPAGQLAHKFGSRRLICGAMLTNCVVSIGLPLTSFYGGWVCTVIFRIVQGLSQSCIVPSIHSFFGKWAPLEERGRLTALTYGGQALGAVLGLPITGFISSTSLGWPGIFRFYGVLAGIIGVVVWFSIAETPAQHPKISLGERKYIEHGLGIKEENKQKEMPVPWSHILRSPGMYAIVVGHVGHAWGQLFLYSELPAFMDKVMGFNIKANGLLTALPFLVMWFTNFFFSWFTDMLIVKKVLSVTDTRKLAQTLGCIPPAIGLIALAYLPKNIYVVETILILICAFKISAHFGFMVNHIDISPNFAGTMMSVSNFCSNLVSSLAPILAGFILTDVNDEKLWRKVFFVAAGFYLSSNLFYVIYGTAEKADWNEPDYNKEKKPDDEEASIAMLKKESELKSNN